MAAIRRAPGFVVVLSILLVSALGCSGPDDRNIEDGGLLDGDTDGSSDTLSGGCRRHEQCGEEQICNESTGLCEPVYGRRYLVGITNVSLHRNHSPDGSDWDDDESLPDPFVCFTFGDGHTQCTEVEQDTPTPVFGLFTMEVDITQYQQTQLEICDDDTPDEPSCWLVADLPGVAVQTLRAGTLTLFPDDPTRMDDWAITVSFNPIAS